MQVSEKRRGLVDVSSTIARRQRLGLREVDRMLGSPDLVCCIHFQPNRKAMGRDPNWTVDRMSLVHDRRLGQLQEAAAQRWVCNPCECQYSIAVGLSVSPRRRHPIQEQVRLLEDLPPTGKGLEVILMEPTSQAHP
jgi:hypothetical protein